MGWNANGLDVVFRADTSRLAGNLKCLDPVSDCASPVHATACSWFELALNSSGWRKCQPRNWNSKTIFELSGSWVPRTSAKSGRRQFYDIIGKQKWLRNPTAHGFVINKKWTSLFLPDKAEQNTHQVNEKVGFHLKMKIWEKEFTKLRNICFHLYLHFGQSQLLKCSSMNFVRRWPSG